MLLTMAWYYKIRGIPMIDIPWGPFPHLALEPSFSEAAVNTTKV